MFDIIFHFEELPKEGDALIHLNELIDWEIFRPYLKKIHKVNSEGRGRPPIDEIIMFKVIVLQSLNNVSDDKMEFLIKDRLSFMRFLGFQEDKPVFPDAKTIWHFKEQLKEKGILEKIFPKFNENSDNFFRITSRKKFKMLYFPLKLLKISLAFSPHTWS